MTKPNIAMLSDFGNRDAYVGTMKAVMLGICPGANVFDLCHEAPPQNVLSGSYLLATAIPFLPQDTIVLGVVDPGVGTTRRAVVVETDDVVFVGPDNGLMTLSFERTPPVRAHSLDNPDYQLPEVSNTFHGRDIFSPAAAHVASGVSPEEFGEEIDVRDLVRLPEIGPLIKESSIECRVVHIDHFGNVITNLSRRAMERMGSRPTHIRIESQDAPFAATFAEVERGKPVCYFNSTNYLELGVRNRSAADYFELGQRDALHVVTESN